MTKIIAISDLHGELPDVPECDLLLLGGDLCPDGPPIFQSNWLDFILRNWLKKVPAANVVAIAGNHDLIFESANYLIPKGLRWNYLQDQAIEIQGFKIYGTPWQLPFWGAFNLKEEELQKKYANIPQDVDILLSHGAPYGIRDEAHNVHTGSISLRNKIFEIKPKLSIFGHIHECFGIEKIEDTLFANVSLSDVHRNSINGVTSFTLDNANQFLINT